MNLDDDENKGVRILSFGRPLSALVAPSTTALITNFVAQIMVGRGHTPNYRY